MTTVPEDRDYPAPPVPAGHVEPAPRRVRGVLAGAPVFDTTRARYVWEWPFYPQYYVPVDDIAPDLLIDEQRTQKLKRGVAAVYGLRVGDQERPGSVRVYGADADPAVAGTARVDWDALDAWFEEDEQVFVHPRNPYVRVDALRSRRSVRVELGGVVLAESDAPVLVFETGLPTRFYLDRTALNWAHLRRTGTETACPYKGVTTDYWSVVIGDEVHADLAWSYAFPTRQLLPIAGLVAFYDEHVDTYVDGELRPRPVTHFSRR